jgi:chondroitin AC lyase
MKKLKIIVMQKTTYIRRIAVIFLILPFHLFAQNDFSIIRKNIVENFQGEMTDAAILKQVKKIAPLQSTDGSWSDIDYKDNSITLWKPATHLERLKLFAIAVTKRGSIYFENAGLHSTIIAGLRYWYGQNPKSKNWWHNEIATPQDLGEIMLLSQNFLPTNLQDSLVDRMKRGNPYEKTGANKLDEAIHYLYRACITKNKLLMESAVQQAFQPISFTTEEGLQYDYSYQQHGPQLQISSYGLVFLSGEYKVASWVNGTAYALNAEKKKMLGTYFTQTFLKTIRGRYSDFNVEGRGISRPDILDKESIAGSKRSHSLIDLAKEVSPPRAALLDSADLRLTEVKDPGYGVSATHSQFWKGDYTIHLRKKYSFNVRAVSTRTKRTETGNKEDLLGKFLADGSTDIQRSGSEYYNIMPIWEWDKIPGVTSRDFKQDQPMTIEWGESGSTNFTGGVSDGIYGAAVYDMDYNDVKAKKSYFFFDHEVICLGTGINSGSAENITTTLNQCWLKSDVKFSVDGKINDAKQEENIANPDWVWQDSIGYVFLQPANVNITAGKQTGNWAAINASRSKEEISGNVFKLWINHGVKPSDANYAYMVVPDIDVKEMNTYKKQPIKIIENTNSIQAVKDEQLQMIQVVFHKAGSISDNGVFIAADKPCVVLLKNINSKNVVLHVADPHHKNSEVIITVKSKLLTGEKKAICHLPTGNFAGSSAMFSLN